MPDILEVLRRSFVSGHEFTRAAMLREMEQFRSAEGMRVAPECPARAVFACWGRGSEAHGNKCFSSRAANQARTRNCILKNAGPHSPQWSLTIRNLAIRSIPPNLKADP